LQILRKNPAPTLARFTSSLDAKRKGAHWTERQGSEPQMIIGYDRVSTDGQTLDTQHAALKAAGAEKVLHQGED
jgi:hypothetical protein